MMFSCSAASELSNYDSCQSVHFHISIQLSFCLVMYSGAIRGWFKQKWRGARFERRHEKFTNFSQNLSMEGEIVNNRADQDQ